MYAPAGSRFLMGASRRHCFGVQVSFGSRAPCRSASRGLYVTARDVFTTRARPRLSRVGARAVVAVVAQMLAAGMLRITVIPLAGLLQSLTRGTCVVRERQTNGTVEV